MQPSLSVTKKGLGLGGINAALADLREMDVLVGIPERTASRGNEPLNNAELLFIQTFGVNHPAVRAGVRAILAVHYLTDYWEWRRTGLRAGTTGHTDLNSPAYWRAREMYVQSHGSPGMHIPARPVIEPAIAYPANREIITRELGEAAASMLEHDPAKAERYMNRAGIAGMNAAKGWFTNPANGWPPNAPSTIARKGSDRPLIDTGSLRRAITFVVRAKIGA